MVGQTTEPSLVLERFPEFPEGRDPGLHRAEPWMISMGNMPPLLRSRQQEPSAAVIDWHVALSTRPLMSLQLPQRNPRPLPPSVQKSELTVLGLHPQGYFCLFRSRLGAGILRPGHLGLGLLQPRSLCGGGGAGRGARGESVCVPPSQEPTPVIALPTSQRRPAHLLHAPLRSWRRGRPRCISAPTANTGRDTNLRKATPTRLEGRNLS